MFTWERPFLKNFVLVTLKWLNLSQPYICLGGNVSLSLNYIKISVGLNLNSSAISNFNLVHVLFFTFYTPYRILAISINVWHYAVRQHINVLNVMKYFPRQHWLKHDFTDAFLMTLQAAELSWRIGSQGKCLHWRCWQAFLLIYL